MSEIYTCEFCEARLTAETAKQFDGKILCELCLDEYTTLCDCCLDRIWRIEAEGNRTVTLCHYCYENNYCNCSGCGCLIHNDDAR